MIPVAETGQHLLFRLAGELYGLDLSRVLEIVDYRPVTRVPEAPAFMAGVINIRGKIVPIVDLRLKLSLPRAKPSRAACFVIAEAELPGETSPVGLLVDGVHVVHDFAPGAIAPPPSHGAGIRPEYIHGLVPLGRELVVILDLRRLLAYEELVPPTEIRDNQAIRRMS